MLQLLANVEQSLHVRIVVVLFPLQCFMHSSLVVLLLPLQCFMHSSLLLVVVCGGLPRVKSSFSAGQP